MILFTTSLRAWLFGLLIALIFPASASGLPEVVRQALTKARIPETAVGVYVREVDASQPLLAINADAAMNPASVMKLVTTYAGLELLGPAYTWRTEVYASGTLEQGKLTGDLIIKGYGDPNLNLENFWVLMRQIRQTGLKAITGDLVLDYSHYSLSQEDPGAFDGQPYKTYNVLPEALLVNYRTSAVHLFPDPQHDRVRVIADPETPLLDLQNNLRLTKKKCGYWRNAVRADVRPHEAGNGHVSVLLNGAYSVDCGQNTYYLSLHESTAYIYDLFRDLWSQLGGTFEGGVRRGSVPESLLPLKVYHSPPLAEVIRGINKYSNNVAARQLFLSLGETQANGEKFVSLDLAYAAIQQWLFAKRLNFPEMIIENGSGLSRRARISARHLGDLLQVAYHSPVMPELMASLAIVAVDGTARNRLKRSGVAARAHIKTGSLRDVSAVAGYVLGKNNRRYVVVFMANHANAANAKPAIDRLLEWLYQSAK
ncbi:D-alanyl-D-alanine carboxypeptidase/D-alanyl-D-alanine endopeptidase [Nitrosomonas halophila]|jgi:serine-type D-Ala-D-Ala carboxypeptidase/endopeptidase (penicillin-binding protein 4)|uniref:D-alanyl-D-alanine carboxypeptidase/D-alanyl-D-alanine endopeptidase n=1 Tax=Nitrosomonas halophila TaxID=44576 RepID=UPI000B816E7D|nr:D-alanyl-D-alanine carboxypeptidase/D-alanyl-D-alanine-endopeptidase [Nitrosomonas halophila]